MWPAPQFGAGHMFSAKIVGALHRPDTAVMISARTSDQRRKSGANVQRYLSTTLSLCQCEPGEEALSENRSGAEPRHHFFTGRCVTSSFLYPPTARSLAPIRAVRGDADRNCLLPMTIEFLL